MTDSWWLQETEDELHSTALAFADDLFSRQWAERRARANDGLFLYNPTGRLSLSGGTSDPRTVTELIPPYFNLIQTVCDWFTSMIVRNKIRPYILTEAGDSQLQEQAKQAMLFTEGVMREAGIWDSLGMLRAQDGHLFEGGGIKWTADVENSRIVASRVRPWEVFVPEREGRLGNPRQWLHRQSIDRGILASMFEEGSEERVRIEAEEPLSYDADETISGDRSDMVAVRELWHLPSGAVDLDNPLSFGLDDNGEPTDEDPGHDGKRVMMLKSGILVSEPWPFPRTNISWYLPRRDPIGVWSRSIPETLAGAQLELLDIGDKIQQILRRHAVPHLIVWRQARLNLQKFTNDTAAILESNVPPQQAVHYLVPQSVPSELLNREQQIIAWGKAQAGVTDMALTGEKPKGVDHAPGMEHLSETTIVRHTSAYQAFEHAHVEDAEIIIDVARFLKMKGANMSVVYGEDKRMQRVELHKLNLSRDKFHIKVFPSNFFPQLPQGRVAMAEKLTSMGAWAGTPAANKLLKLVAGDAPDIDAEVSADSAEERNIEMRLAKLLKGATDEEVMPHPYMNLDAAKATTRKWINMLEADGEEEKRVERIRDFWTLCDKVQKQTAPPPQVMPVGGAPGPAPSAGGVPPAPVAAMPPAA